MSAVYPGNSDFGARPVGRNSADPSVFLSSPSDSSRSFASEIYTNKFGQKGPAESLRRYGHPVYQKAGDRAYFEKQAVRYPAKAFRDIGFFNGFPFLLPENVDYLSSPADEMSVGGELSVLPSGISERYATGIYVDTTENSTTKILGGSFNLTSSNNTFKPTSVSRPVAANQFWNLACIETDWVIQTRTTPAGYSTGYCYNPDGVASTEGLQLVTQDFEVVESYSFKSFPPHLRQYIDATGDSAETQSIDENHIIQGSGASFSSCFFLGQDTGSYANAFFPLTIQPENTGAFVITLDQGVSDYFDSNSDFGSSKAFNCNMMFDFNIRSKDEEGFERNAIEYHSFPTKAYIIPAAGWEFDVICSKVKGIYYQYPFNPAKRFVGDQASFLNYKPLVTGDLKIIHSKNAPMTEGVGGEAVEWNGLPLTHMPFEPTPQIAGVFSDIPYGHYFELEANKTYLTPKLSEHGIDGMNRQSYSDPGPYTTAGTDPDSMLDFYVGGPRVQTTIDADVLGNHVSLKKELDVAADSSNQIVSAKRFTATPYFGVASQARSAKSNPRKLRNSMSRKILNEEIGADRAINVKIGDLTSKKVSSNPIVACGVRKSFPVTDDNPDFRSTQLSLKRKYGA
jgi:hypothetical protein